MKMLIALSVFSFNLMANATVSKARISEPIISLGVDTLTTKVYTEQYSSKDAPSGLILLLRAIKNRTDVVMTTEVRSTGGYAPYTVRIYEIFKSSGAKLKLESSSDLSSLVTLISNVKVPLNQLTVFSSNISSEIRIKGPMAQRLFEILASTDNVSKTSFGHLSIGGGDSMHGNMGKPTVACGPNLYTSGPVKEIECLIE